MKKKDDDLFQLIKSLTRNEKGYFVKFAASVPGRDGNRYMELFRVIDTMKTYDENLLQKRLAILRFPKQVHRIRHYLYNSIMNSLEQYHKETTASHKIHILLRQAYILTERKLYDQSNTLLDKAGKLAEHFSRQNSKYEILTLKLRNQLALNNAADWTFTKKIVDEMFLSSLIHQHSVQAYKAYIDLSGFYYKSGKAQTAKQKAAYTKLFINLSKNINAKHLNKSGKLNFAQAKYMYGMATGEDEIAVAGLESAHTILKSNLHILENKKVFSSVTYNLLIFYLEQKKFPQVEKTLTEMGAWLASHQKDLNKDVLEDMQVAINMHWFNLIISNHQKEYDKSFIAKIISFFNGKILSPRFRFKHMFNLAVYHLYNHNIKQSLEHINDMLNDKDFKEQASEILPEVELLGLFVHAKLGNLNLLNYTITNLKRKIRKDKTFRHKTFTGIMLNQIAAYPGNHRAEYLRTWKKKITEAIKQYAAEHPFDFAPLEFDYVWYFENIF